MPASSVSSGPHLPFHLALLLFLPSPLLAQADGVAAPEWAETGVEENVRSDPNGTILGRLLPGTRVQVVGREGNWSQVTFQGAVWLPSLQARTFGSFDLMVAPADGENLRSEPRGRIVGHLDQGTLLEERSREPGWAHVRRTAWIWSPSLQTLEEIGEDEPRVPTREAPTQDEEGAPQAAPGPGDRAAPGGVPGEGWVRAPSAGGAILSAPDGDTLAGARGGSELRVLGREGRWARVQLEGWLWLPEGNGEEEAEEEPPVLRGVQVGDLTGSPERFRGRVVEMTLQFVSLERAERLRTDFQEGEPFLLTRAQPPDRGFVYVALPAARVGEGQRLAPLARLRVVGRVRTTAAALTGSPILDLMELEVLR